VAGALHGFPVRITGIEEVEPLAREVRGQLRAPVPALGILAALAWVHWRPLVGALLPR